MSLEILFLSGVSFFSVLAAALFALWRGVAKLRDAQVFLRKAKQEAREIAQIPLNDPHPLIQLSASGEILFVNPAALEIFSGLREQGSAHPVLRGLSEMLARGQAEMREVEFAGRIYHQTITPAEVNGQGALIVYSYDMTERKEYEKALRQSRAAAEEAQAQAENANRARGDFLANMSHELRTPMNGIIGLSDILIEAGMKPEHREMAEAVNSSARNLLILLNDILDFSKIEAGELSMEAIPFDLRKVIRQIESLQSPVAARKGLAMKSAVADGVPPYLIGDPSRLQQVLNNLISNALKFTEKGSVTLAVDGQGDGRGHFVVRIAVRDTGIGIPKDKQDKVFAKFQQADTSTARKYGGTGLGLAITKDLVSLMNGKISIQSEEGKGTIFTVVFPAKIAAAAGVNEERVEGSGQPGGGIDTTARILVVDDHPVNLLFMRKSLANMGFTAFDEASSGRQALDFFAKNRYDLILMDCQMPEMDGFTAARKIRAMGAVGSEPVIIAVTADAMKGAADKCRAAGMDDYISKPVDKDKLRLLLQEWLPGEAGRGGSEERTEVPAEKTIEAGGGDPVLDWDHLHNFTDGDPQAERDLFALFLENLDQDIDHLEISYKNRSYAEWDEVAHKLYGACSHIGAAAMAKVCNQAQSLSEAEAEKVPVLHRAILQEYARVRDVLTTRKAA